MKVIMVKNVREAYYRVLTDALAVDNGTRWHRRDSRNGPVMEYREPVATVYTDPRDRVMLDRERDANPFFHLMEALWMLAGRDDVKWISQFNKNIAQYSDDGFNFHGAYGFRWRQLYSTDVTGQLPLDQINKIIDLLFSKPDTRRAVLTMWDPVEDLGVNSKDIPCNTHVYFKIRDDKLNMMVCCRSNDVIWGAYGANAVHFSILQEYVAARVGVEVGEYTHVSDSFHIYEDNPALQRHRERGTLDPKSTRSFDPVARVPLIHGADNFEIDLRSFFGDKWNDSHYAEPFFDSVALPMRIVWNQYKQHGAMKALIYTPHIGASDWRLACTEWLERREK